MKKAEKGKTENISGIGRTERLNQSHNHLLGANIKRLRVERGLQNRDVICQLQLRGIDICSSSYSKVEAGKTNPTVDMVRTLAQIYQCEYEEFFRE